MWDLKLTEIIFQFQYKNAIATIAWTRTGCGFRVFDLRVSSQKRNKGSPEILWLALIRALSDLWIKIMSILPWSWWSQMKWAIILYHDTQMVMSRFCCWKTMRIISPERSSQHLGRMGGPSLLLHHPALPPVSLYNYSTATGKQMGHVIKHLHVYGF